MRRKRAASVCFPPSCRRRSSTSRSKASLRHLTQGGPQALAKIKDLIRAVASGPVDDALIADTAKRIAEIRVSPEGKEGIASFLEKRKPAWASGADAARAEPATGKK